MRRQLADLAWLGTMLAAIWAIQAVNTVTAGSLNRMLGLVPRELDGLIGVPMMPLLHGGIGHAAANTLPLLVLGGLLGLTAPRRVFAVSALVIGLGGLAVWLFARPAVHVGASGLIFGWFGFLIARGLFERNLLNIAVAAGVAAVYGTMIWGVLPLQAAVSWEAHLFGAAAGVAAAGLLRKD